MIDAAQLLFSNVEAEQSPTRTRGFQVWLASRSLSAERRKLVAKRVDDYKLPTPAPADAASFRRTVYAELSDGAFVFAQTVPLDGRDKFGRGGRFHAHAVCLTADEFAAAGRNPGAVLGGLSGLFRESPEDDLHHVTGRDSELPPLPLAPSPPIAEVSVPPAVLAQLAANLLGASPKVVAVVAPPSEVLRLALAILSGLPAKLRARLTLDTLSAGASLSTLPYALVGCPDAGTLARWPFRRYVRLDPESWALAPGLVTGPVPLPASLLAEAGWGELDEAAGESAWSAAEAITAGRFGDECLRGLAEPVAGFVAALPQVQARIDAEFGPTLPAELRDSPSLRGHANRWWADLSPAEKLAALAGPMPLWSMLWPLFDEWGAGRPPAAELAAVSELALADCRMWGKLALVCARWDESVPPEACRELADELGELDWFDGWARSTLAAWLRLPGMRVVEALRGQKFLAGDLRELRLAAATAPESDAAELAYAAALCGGADSIRAIIGTPLGRGPQSLIDVVAATGAKVEWGYAKRSHGYAVGLFVADPDELIGDTLEALRDKERWAVMDRSLFPAGAPELLHGDDPTFQFLDDPMAKKIVQALMAPAFESQRAGLVAALRGAPDRVFRQVAEGCVAGRFIPQMGARPEDDSTWFVGLDTAPLDPGNKALAVALRALGVLLGAVMPERGPPPAPHAPEARRLWWLLHRLRDPNGTARLMIPSA